MEKFWKYFKLVVLVWGFIWLGIALFIAAMLLIQNLTNRHDAKPEKPIDTSFKKTVGEYAFVAREDSNDYSRLLLTITKQGKELAANYELPTKQFELGWSKVKDARVYTTENGKHSVVLLLESEESDHEYSHEYILQFSLADKLEFNRLVDLANPREIFGDESLQYGSRIIELPSVENEGFETIDIPVIAKIDSTVKVCPLLNQRHLELQRRHYGKIIQRRIDLLSKPDDAKLKKQYLIAQKEFEEITAGDGRTCE